ncbi:F0F1 ATP synthase subunit B [Roseomonas terrae]|jgi:F-type H+-transporting ATPase subunit b|uniref:ATP synthase subunit b n=1 Tax=Neoroseomonas terrae TaxID=424799 RepID=A0ABS5ENX6_9PROT|nr:F0F1 ATP synthase subunit B [Neoroseomonas terrae]MBR0652718.1 F0F1 ATP synthase subunit B [Neoroseomonas terrae]
MHSYEHFWLDPKFWVAVSFVLFFLLLGKKLWGAIGGALDGKAETIRKQLAEASRLRAEAEQMLKDAEAERATAAKDAEELLARATAEAERVGAAAAAEAEAAAKRRERMALDRIAAAEASAVADVRNAAADIAGAAARAVLTETLDARADAALVDQSVTELPKALRAA